ncbi:hypothetical protein CR513_32914, partial [Mucuna pruriens]
MRTLKLNVCHNHEMLNSISISRLYFLESRYKEVMSNLLNKPIPMKYKGKGNIREYIMDILKLELNEDLLVHLVLISFPTYFGQLKISYILKRTNGPSMSLYLTMCKRKRGFKEIRLKQKKQKNDEEFTYYFYKKSRYIKKQCSKYVAWCIKRGYLMGGFWWVPSDDEKFIFMDDGSKLKIEFHLDLFETFVMSSFTQNLFLLITLTNLDFVVLWELINSYNEILRTNFEVCVECIKGKQTNIRKLCAQRAKDILELIHTNICGPFHGIDNNLYFNLERKLKSSNLIMVVNTMLDMMNQENNIQDPLYFFFERME